jgi:hypothetical protein
MGITGWLDAGGRGMGPRHYETYRTLADRGELNVRAFWTTIQQPSTPEGVDKVLAVIAQQKPFQGGDYFDNVGWGESGYSPVTTQLLRVVSNKKPEDLFQFKRVAQGLAERLAADRARMLERHRIALLRHDAARLHEAFGQPVVFDPQPGAVVDKQPPEPVDELPPDVRPEGDNIIWIPGYWSWDDQRTDFIWISGFWRALDRMFGGGFLTDTGRTAARQAARP